MKWRFGISDVILGMVTVEQKDAFAQVSESCVSGTICSVEVSGFYVIFSKTLQSLHYELQSNASQVKISLIVDKRSCADTGCRKVRNFIRMADLPHLKFLGRHQDQ